jgi:spore coat protein U-like protein
MRNLRRARWQHGRKEKTMKQRIAVLLMLGTLPGAGIHAQQTAQTTFHVKARVQAVCEVTATDLEFGTYTSKVGTRLEGQTLLRATCTPGSTYNIGLNEGTTAGASITARAMKPVTGTQNLSYQLYSIRLAAPFGAIRLARTP